MYGGGAEVVRTEGGRTGGSPQFGSAHSFCYTPAAHLINMPPRDRIMITMMQDKSARNAKRSALARLSRSIALQRLMLNMSQYVVEPASIAKIH